MIRDLTKSALSFSWALSLLGMRQAASLLTPNQRRTGDLLAPVTQTAVNQLDDSFKGVFRTGDNLQTRAVDMMFVWMNPASWMNPAGAMRAGNASSQANQNRPEPQNMGQPGQQARAADAAFFWMNPLNWLNPNTWTSGRSTGNCGCGKTNCGCAQGTGRINQSVGQAMDQAGSVFSQMAGSMMNPAGSQGQPHTPVSNTTAASGWHQASS